METTTRKYRSLYGKRNPGRRFKNQRNFKNGNMNLFTLKIEKCLLELITNLKGTSGYDEVTTTQDGVKLLVKIRRIMC